MSIAARTIIELNIKYYRNLLRSETNAARRETIAKLDVSSPHTSRFQYW